MKDSSLEQTKPVVEEIRPEITRLPELTFRRRVARAVWRWASRLLIRLFTRPEVSGLENFPRCGPALVIVNHLGDADILMGLAYFPAEVEAFAKAELYDFPLLGPAMRAYGVIWVHRGLPDRRALRAGLQALRQGQILGIAPEGRESITGALEPGTRGAAYLAYRSGVPIVPVTFTGTENIRVLSWLKLLRRPRITLKVGGRFFLPAYSGRREALERGTEEMMIRLARQLPPEYRGAYRTYIEDTTGDEQGSKSGKYRSRVSP